MTGGKGLVQKGRRSPGPKVPVTRELLLGIFRGLLAEDSDERAVADLTAVLDHAEKHARATLADRDVADSVARDQARMLLERIEVIRAGVADSFAGWRIEHYLLTAIDLGAYLQDLGFYYLQQPGRPPLYHERHFQRMNTHMAGGLTKEPAAIETLRETDSKLSEAELKSRARGLYQAHERWMRRIK